MVRTRSVSKDSKDLTEVSPFWDPPDIEVSDVTYALDIRGKYTKRRIDK